MKSFEKIVLNPEIILAFVLSFFFWGYLFVTTEPRIVYDAMHFQSLGEIIHKDGWIEYFQRGPNREPLYPLLVSISMRLGDSFSISFLHIQRLFQVFILFLTQLLMLRTLKELQIHDTITALILLYIGISPAIVNSTFSLFSEMIAYPLILGILWMLTKSWRSLPKDPLFKALLNGACLGVLFVLIISVKVIFIFVFPILLCPYLCLTFYAFVRENTKMARNLILFILVAVTIVFSFVHFIKLTNKKYNNHYVFTDRGSGFLYGTVARRTIEATSKDFLTAASMIPGDGVCNSFFGREECYRWTFLKADELGAKKNAELMESGVTPIQADKQLMYLSLKRILKNPFQYAIFHLMEGGRMFFWESTQIGFVVYPPLLERIFISTFFKNGLRLAVGILTLSAFVFIVWFVWRKKHLLLNCEDQESEMVQASFFVVLLIIAFIALYSFFAILTRYSFPIIPLYLIAISLFCQKLTSLYKRV